MRHFLNQLTLLFLGVGVALFTTSFQPPPVVVPQTWEQLYNQLTRPQRAELIRLEKEYLDEEKRIHEFAVHSYRAVEVPDWLAHVPTLIEDYLQSADREISHYAQLWHEDNRSRWRDKTFQVVGFDATNPDYRAYVRERVARDQAALWGQLADH